MKTYTFSVTAHISADAETEMEARIALLNSLYETDVDAPYGVGMVYVPSTEMLTAELVDVLEEEGA